MIPGLYIHIPFCDHICSYCDFCKVFYEQDIVDKYLDMLQKEIDMLNKENNYQSIYIGGGTPSSLSYQQLQRLMDMLSPFIHSSLKEVTMEVNPESMDSKKLEIISSKVNRLSIGVQTFQEHLLQGIERVHTNKEVFQVIKDAKLVGISNISIDMMYGLPNQTFDDIKQDLAIIKQLDIQHLSYYSLILEDHTVLKNNDYQELSEKDDLLYNEYIDKSLQEINLLKYEVSNYSKKGYESVHNSTYWKYNDYDAIGAGAVSKVANVISEHSKNIYGYLKEPKVTSFINDKEEMMFEHIMMSLRLVKGLDILDFNQRYEIDFYKEYQDVVNKHLKLETLIIKENFISCTNKSLFYLNSILVDFME